MSDDRGVELVFFPDCPHTATARTNLEHALGRVGRAPTWREWDLAGPSVPDHALGHASPTVLVDGRDVTGRGPTASPGVLSCRTDGAPTVAQIMAALSGPACSGAGTP